MEAIKQTIAQNTGISVRALNYFSTYTEGKGGQIAILHPRVFSQAKQLI